MRSLGGGSRARSGFTLVETTVALTLFSVVGYVLLLAADTSNKSRRTVMEMAGEGRALRKTNDLLVEELAASSDGRITVGTLGDGNHRLDFMLPIDDGGTAAWGVLGGATPHPGWQVRYTVLGSIAENGELERTLVRQVLDGSGVVQSSASLLAGLRSGTDEPPGFRVVKTGDVWELTLSAGQNTQGGSMVREVFHVHARN